MFMISEPMIQLMAMTGIEPTRLNRAMTQRVRYSMGPMVCSDHFPRLIAKATGAALSQVTRRNRAVLIELSEGSLVYRERSRLDCIVCLAGTLPEIAASASEGRTLGEIVALGPASSVLSNCRVIQALDSWFGSVAFSLDPNWVRYN